MQTKLREVFWYVDKTKRQVCRQKRERNVDKTESETNKNELGMQTKLRVKQIKMSQVCRQN